MVLALVTTCTVTFAATESPFLTKGEYFGRSYMTVMLDEDEDDTAQIEVIVSKMFDYLDDNLMDEEQFRSFCSGFTAGIYATFQDLGISKDEADTYMDVDYIVRLVADSILEEFKGRLECNEMFGY